MYIPETKIGYLVYSHSRGLVPATYSEVIIYYANFNEKDMTYLSLGNFENYNSLFLF